MSLAQRRHPDEVESPSPRLADLAHPLKVLHLVDSLGVGGAETWLVSLLRFWRAQGGVQTDILATGGVRSVFDDEATALGARIHYLRFGRDNLAVFARGFRRILADGGYDALHDHQAGASGWHYLIGRGRLPPIRVTHVHSAAPARRRIVDRVGMSLTARYATHIAGTSRAAIAALGFEAPAFARTPRAALYCGLDPAGFLASAAARGAVRGAFGWPGDAQIVLFAGRFDDGLDVSDARSQKNSGFAVDIALDCARRREDVRFIFAGKPSAATPLLRQRIEAAGFGDRIAFAGVRTDIGRLMGASDALLFPSRAEGLGMVVVEAQAAGMPVLASAETPREGVVIPELVQFERLDAGPAQWADRLLALLGAPKVDPLAANARVAASAFSIGQSARNLAALYRSGTLP
jgi:glycosyltransferase involved in cell wall biosynthesis